MNDPWMFEPDAQFAGMTSAEIYMAGHNNGQEFERQFQKIKRNPMTPENLRNAAETSISQIHVITGKYNSTMGPWPVLLEIKTILDELRESANDCICHHGFDPRCPIHGGNEHLP